MKARNKDLVPLWAERPDAFELEPKHVQDEFRAEVEALRKKKEKSFKAKEVEPEALKPDVSEDTPAVTKKATSTKK